MCQVFRSLGLLVSMVAGSNGTAPFRRCETQHIGHFYAECFLLNATSISPIARLDRT